MQNSKSFIRDNSLNKAASTYKNGKSAKRSSVYKPGNIATGFGFMEQTIQQYKNVSLFEWYTPKNLKKLSCEDEKNPVPYNDLYKVSLKKDLLNRGFNFFLKEPKKLLVNLNLNQTNDIIPSYEIKIPLKVDLLCLKDVTQIISQTI